MRRQKKDWTSAYAKVTKARGGKAEELATDEHEKTRKEEGRRKQKQKTNTEGRTLHSEPDA